MKNLLPILIFAAILVVIDVYAFKSLRVVSSSWTSNALRLTLSALYILSSLLAYGLLIYAILSFSREASSKSGYYIMFMGFGILLLIFIPKLIVAATHILDDLVHLFRRIATYFIITAKPDQTETVVISRWDFLSKIGWLMAALPFIGILYGMIRGRFAFRIEDVPLSFEHLPPTADGLKVIHISDIHIGSFFENHEAVLKGIEKINELNPDLILFTGDFVNNYASELNGWIEHFSKLKAKYGKYSILGNHDYGDYVRWPNDEEKRANLERLKKMHSEMGFRLLLNEWVPIEVDQSEKIELIGVENWGMGGFSKYGNLNKAMRGTDPNKFQILMSHDPSHWDAEVLEKTSIDLTLSGHTHGMQFGVEIPGIIKWSPVKYRYPRWGGLYTELKQHLYVNRGFGYIGFPGRVGMPPEITAIRLNKI